MFAFSSRRGVLHTVGALLAGSVAALALSATPAAADKSAEDYVATNAQAVLTSLSAGGSSAERRQKFGVLMDKFADTPRIAEFVLGKYARTARADPALYGEWRKTFRNYAMAVYETQLDAYRGREIKVSPGSKDTVINGRTYSVVSSQIITQSGQPFLVNWRLLQQPDKSWKVVDVALKLEDNVIWLAIQQQQEFLARLDRNGGDVAKLMADVKALTAKMNAEARGDG